MNISEQIISVFNTLCEKFGIVIDWTAANVLPYVQDLCGRIITYSIASNIVEIVFLTISLITMIFTFKFFFKKGTADDWYSDSWIIGSVVSGIALVLFCVVFIVIIPTDIMDIVQACTIPELTVMEIVEDFIEAKGA